MIKLMKNVCVLQRVLLVEKGDDGTYWGATQNVPGVVSAFGNSLEELKANTQAAFADYIETTEQCKEDWVDDVKEIKQVEFYMNISVIRESVD